MLNTKEIIDMYVNQGYSTNAIAKEYDTYPNKIKRLLKKHNIPLNSKSVAQKQALKYGRSKHPTKGTKRNNEVKRRISQTVYDNWCNLSEEKKQKRIDLAKEQWYNKTEEERKEFQHAASEGVRKAAKEGSKLEKFLYQELSKKYHIEFHKTNLIVNEQLEIDMFLPELKVIIEVDGPSHFFPMWGKTEQERHKNLQKHINSDTKKSGILLSKGFVIIRIKNITKNLSLVLKRKTLDAVMEHLTSIEKQFPPKSKRYIELEVS